MIVDEDAGEGRVPGYEDRFFVLVEPFLLKEDMVHMEGEQSSRLDKTNDWMAMLPFSASPFSGPQSHAIVKSSS